MNTHLLANSRSRYELFELTVEYNSLKIDIFESRYFQQSMKGGARREKDTTHKLK